MNEIFASLGIAPIQIVINAVGFLVLLFLLNKFLFGPVGTILEQRRERIVSDRAEAERFRSEMERRNRELEQRLGNIEAEVRDRMQRAEREAQTFREQQLEEARRERERIVEAGIAELRREREKMLVEIRDLVADLATVAASKIIETELDLDAHRKMVDDIVEHGVQ